MRLKTVRILLICGLALLLSKPCCLAQFKDEAFSQNYGDVDGEQADTTSKIFDVKKYFHALGHKTTMNVATSFEGSLVCVGGMQIYNKDYWKLPIVYGGIAAGIGGGIYYGSQGNSKASTLCYLGAGLTYWATLMDGVISYEPNDWPNPQKATLYSLLLPGLGLGASARGKIAGGIGFVITSQLRLYSKAFSQSDVLDTAYCGDCVVILRQEKDWYRVIFNLQEGYMRSDCLDGVGQLQLHGDTGGNIHIAHFFGLQDLKHDNVAVRHGAVIHQIVLAHKGTALVHQNCIFFSH